MTIEVSPAVPSQPPLRLWDTVSIIVGIVVGVGIYETPPEIFSLAAGPGTALWLWLAGGLLSLVGAFCFAELASSYPESGGDYVYLSKAFGPWAGFLFGWSQLTIIRTGNIGMMAYVFADYAVKLWDWGPASAYGYAVGAVAILTVLNALGIVLGKSAQNLLTGVKVVGLAGIVLAGFLMPAVGPGSDSADLSSQSDMSMNIGLALLFILYTYGGWNDAALVAAEQRGGRRNIVLSLLLGTVAVSIIYILVNAAYLSGLSFDGARTSKAIAADLMSRAFGAWGGKCISLLVMVSALGAINGMILTGARVYWRMGAENRLFRLLGSWNAETGSPAPALWAQFLVSAGLITLVGTNLGLSAITTALSWLRLPAVTWTPGRDAFSTLLGWTTPAFWLFMLGTGLSLFVLRQQDRSAGGGFRVPFYPIVPLIFCATCLFVIYYAIDYAQTLAIIPAILVLSGLPVYFLSSQSTHGSARRS